MAVGKSLRMKSIFRESSGRSVIVAIDHGGIAGPITGIEKPKQVLKECMDGGADAILTTRGFVKAAADNWARGTSLILRLTGGFTTLGGKFEEELVSSVESALMYNSSGVAVTVKFGHLREGEFIKQASLIADSCERWGMPLMVEAMAKGNSVKQSNDPAGIKIAARAAQEIGADIIKTYYTGSKETFSEVTAGCPVPVLILGGQKTSDTAVIFQEVHDAIQAGAEGIAIGRNIWQHGNTRKMVEAMCGIVHEDWSVEKAIEFIKQG
ncbi:MAG: fructose-bisphosphate aldolase [Spirochaetes bacterium]|nr:fructose-bisphosphate aldolase [Spirochaetota bacterium]